MQVFVVTRTGWRSLVFEFTSPRLSVEMSARREHNMKMPADSVLVATINLVLIGTYLAQRQTHIGCCGLGSPANVIATVLVPTVLLVSIFFVVKDLLRPSTRLQAIVAVVLSAPSAWVISSIHFG